MLPPGAQSTASLARGRSRHPTVLFFCVSVLVSSIGGSMCWSVSVYGQKTEARRGEELKDIGREERGLGDPVVGDGGSARAHTSLTKLRLSVG